MSFTMDELFKTEKVRVGDLVPSEKNPRKIKAEEKKKLWERLQKYGMIGIPVRDFDGNLLSGNQRCKVVVENGFADMMIDVRTAVRKLTENETKEIMVIENAHAGDWDFELLRQEFELLVDLDDYGISMEQLEQQIQETVEDVAEEPEMPIVPKFSEKYDSIIVVCSNMIDLNHLSERLGLQRTKCYKSSMVGMQYVITAEDLISAFNSAIETAKTNALSTTETK